MSHKHATDSSKQMSHEIIIMVTELNIHIAAK